MTSPLKTLVIKNDNQPFVKACQGSLKLLNSIDMNKTGLNEAGFKYGILSTIVSDPFYNDVDFLVSSEYRLQIDNRPDKYMDILIEHTVNEKRKYFLIELKYVRLAYIDDVKIRKLKFKEFPRPLFAKRLELFEQLLDDDPSRVESMTVNQRWGDILISELVSDTKEQLEQYARLFRFNRTDVKKEDIITFYMIGVANTIIYDKTPAPPPTPLIRKIKKIKKK